MSFIEELQMNSCIDSHLAQTTTHADGGSKNVYKFVCRPEHEDNGSFKNDTSGQLIVLVVVAFFAVMAIFVK